LFVVQKDLIGNGGVFLRSEVCTGAAQLQLRLLFGGYLYIKKIMAVTQPVISDAFLPDPLVTRLQEYRFHDVLSPAYIPDGKYMCFRAGFYTLSGEDGYMYTKVGFAMAENPFLFDPMSFMTPRVLDGTWKASFTVLSGGRPTRYDVSGDNYYDTYEQFIIAYVNTVVPG
jgi:hypothetical protein